MNDVRLIPYVDRMYHAYRGFACRSWGLGCYQGKKSYIDWLYRENPSERVRENDFLVATTTGDDIVGVVHKMRFPWDVDGRVVDIPATHNLFVEEKYRNGLGFYLLSAIRQDETHVFSPSQTPALTQTYRKLQWQEIPIRRYRRTLRPMSASFRYSLASIAPVLCTEPAKVSAILPEHEYSDKTIVATTKPDDRLICALADAMRKRLQRFREKPNWDEATVRWRFFHPYGPRHILFHFRGEDVPSDFLIVSYGNRHGFRTARIIDASLSSPARLARLVRLVERFLAGRGVHFLLAYCADVELIEAFAQAGWHSFQNDEGDAFIFHRERRSPFIHYAINASAGDFGFEAIE